MRSILLMVIVLMAVAVSALAQTDQEKKAEDQGSKKNFLYQWIDQKGVVHITDSLGNVPKQYRDKALTIEESPSKEESVPDQQKTVGPSSLDDDEAGMEEDKKAEWQGRMKAARQRLADAQRLYEELDQKRNELLGAWGGMESGHLETREEADRITQQMKQVQQEIDDARNQIENGIPEEARKAGIPPGWLRE